MRKNPEILRIGLLLLVLVIAIVVAYKVILSSRSLKVYNPADLNPEMVDSSLQGLSASHRVSDFTLLDQQGNTVTQDALAGKIYVADFFFATCQTICPKMSAQMERLSIEFKGDDRVMFLSHTVNPERDTVAALAAYAQEYHAAPDQWLFLTGDKKQLYELARKSYFAVVSEGDGGPNDFIHTQNFMLVDKNKRIRGYYDGTSEDDVNRLIDDIHILLTEKPKPFPGS